MVRTVTGIIRIKVIPYEIYSLDIVDTATESLTTSFHNIETDMRIKEYNAVDIV